MDLGEERGPDKAAFAKKKTKRTVTQIRWCNPVPRSSVSLILQVARLPDRVPISGFPPVFVGTTGARPRANTIRPTLSRDFSPISLSLERLLKRSLSGVSANYRQSREAAEVSNDSWVSSTVCGKGAQLIRRMKGLESL